MPTFADCAAELAGRLPGLSPILAASFIRRIFTEKINRERNWSYLDADGVVLCPTLISTGTVAVVQGATTVTANAAASAALLAVTTPPGLTSLQIRFMGIGTPVTSQIYSILAVNALVPAAIVLTLDRAIAEVTNPTAGYLVYRVYITPPSSDFKSWVSLTDMVTGYNISREKLSYTSSYFDGRDPQRQSLGLGYLLGFYKAVGRIPTTQGAANAPIYELWPGSTQGQTFYVRYRRKGELVLIGNMNDEIPDAMGSDALIEGALAFYGYAHAQANINNFPSFKHANWPTLILHGIKAYQDALRLAKKSDDEQSLKTVYARGRLGFGKRLDGYNGPIDAKFMQAHPITW